MDGHTRHGRGRLGDRHPAHVRKAHGLCRQFFYPGRRRRLVGLYPSGLLGAPGLRPEPFAAIVVHRHYWRPRFYCGQLFWRGVHGVGAGAADQRAPHAGHEPGDRYRFAYRTHGVWRADRLLSDRRAAWPGPSLEHRQGEAAYLALPTLIFSRNILISNPAGPSRLRRTQTVHTDTIRRTWR